MPNDRFHPSYRRLWMLAWPVMLANAATPLLGLVDTAVIGHIGRVSDLGALALGALAFNFLYWAFGFLRMGTTGFVARLAGANDVAGLHATVIRALVLGLALGGALLALRVPVTQLILALLNGSPEVEGGSATYLQIRLLGAPASFGTFALLGVMIGLGKTRELLGVQLLLNSSNVVLDWYLAYRLDLGISGIATGTVVAEWLAFGFISWRVVAVLPASETPSTSWREILRLQAFAPLLKANGNIFVRTLVMLLSFGVFLNIAAGFGNTVLAAHHILLQFITLSAYVLDGYAHAAEPVIGHALGRMDRTHFLLCIRRSIRLSLFSAFAIAALMGLAGPSAIAQLTTHADVVAIATRYLPFAAIYVLLSGLAFQLDGIFIGAGATADMRNMAVAAALVFGAALLTLVPLWGYAGLWCAFIVYVIARGLTLLVRLRTISPG